MVKNCGNDATGSAAPPPSARRASPLGGATNITDNQRRHLILLFKIVLL